ncbi:MAG: hypothetical protein M1831_004297 [Alyxoria varia]|nr:MAG: hypothetical protein M1831_004297 [Alyxoria varia]
MDAKPHRPARSRTIRDENQPPMDMGHKTIHQRNKSSPALSSLAQGNPTKPAPKRAVFADVSNTAKVLQPIKDDTALTKKFVANNRNSKATIDDGNDQAAVLQKPAQRPLSVSGIKSFLGNFASGSHSNAPKPQTSEIPHAPPPKHVTSKPVIQRKTTAVFRESEVPPPELPSHRVPSAKESHVAPLSHNSIDSSVPVEENQDVIDPQLLNQSQESYYPAVGYHPSDQNQTDIRSDGAPLDDVDEVVLPDPVLEITGRKKNEVHRSSGEEAPLREADLNVPQKSQISYIPSAYPEIASEPAQRHEVEPNVEYYYDDDYTTARSLKSRGDMTTGATTVLLAPKVTASVERELNVARNYVQDSELSELDQDEAWDISMVTEYGDEIFEYMRDLEERMRPNPRYMDSQSEVQWSMRSVLMDWLVQVHHRFSLLPETLFLCVNLIDRFLSTKVVSLGKLQLVGATAIFVAAKYEEINCPSVQEIVYMVDGGYTIEEILKAERFMLSMLHFELGWPGPMSFLRRVSKADDYDLETRTLAKYFLEITVMDERFVGCIPSYTAAGSHCLSRLMLRKGPWSLKHIYYSGYTYNQLRPLLSTMVSCCDDPNKHHTAVFDKYGDKRYKRASYFVQSVMDKEFVLPPIYNPALIGNGPLGVSGNCGYDFPEIPGVDNLSILN